MATIVLSRVIPDSILRCHIDHQWQAYFQAKNAGAIRMIQDKLHCCGLRSLHDRAWPFKDRDHGDNTCELQMGYERSCFSPWREQQQVVSSMIVAAVLLSWLCRVRGITGTVSSPTDRLTLSQTLLVRWIRRTRTWMHSGYAAYSPAAVHQRILHRDSSDAEREDDSDAAGRAILPHATPHANEWA